MHKIIDTELYPLDAPDGVDYANLVARCKAELDRDGMFNLNGFLRSEVAQAEAERLSPRVDADSFLHARTHNIYFKPEITGLAADHPAHEKLETSNNTLTADQLDDSPIKDIYHWPAFVRFLADVMDKPALYPMADKLAAFNVMRYGEGQALNWHFDRSEFTVTLLLQAPEQGGVFEYRTDLRTADDPNYDGVATLLRGQDPLMQQMAVTPGTVNVFRGVNTPHRVTPVVGDTTRMIAVLTYYEQPDAAFSDAEQLGFYGRIAR